MIRFGVNRFTHLLNRTVVSVCVFTVFSFGDRIELKYPKKVIDVFYYDVGETDSIVMSGQFDDWSPYYNRIDIYRKGKIIFSYNDSLEDIVGYHGHVFTSHSLSNNNSQLIFTTNDRPGPDKYLVIEYLNGKYVLLGKTSSITNQLFGDIDFDGVFELGGVDDFPQRKFECNDISVFEVKKDFPVDKKLRKKLIEACISNNQK